MDRVERKVDGTAFSKKRVPIQIKLWVGIFVCALVSAAIVPAALYCSSLLVIPVSALCIAFYTRMYLFAAFPNINSAEVPKTEAIKTLLFMIFRLSAVLAIPILVVFILSTTRFSDIFFLPCRPQFFGLDHTSIGQHFSITGSLALLDVNGFKAIMIAASHQLMLAFIATLIVAWSPLLSVCDCLFLHRAVPFDPRKEITQQRKVVEDIHRYRNGTLPTITNIAAVGFGSVIIIAHAEISDAQVSSVVWGFSGISVIAFGPCLIAFALTAVMLARSFGINHVNRIKESPPSISERGALNERGS